MGNIMSSYNANWPPRAKWSTKDIPDLSGKVIIVTGGNTGIGKETVKALLSKRAKVYIASHNKERADATIQELKAITHHEAHFLQLDLASLGSVKAAAEAFQLHEHKLDVLINNAGVMIPDPQAVTAEGYDLQFGVNVVGHYYFTRLLTPQLLAAGSSRIVNLTSHGHTFVDGINWDTVRDGPARQKENMLTLYNQSKFANVVLALEFARRYSDKGVVSTSVHPGLIATNLGRTMSQTIVKMAHYVSYDAAQGALTSLWAATSPETANAKGEYLIPWARFGEAHPNTSNPEVGSELWTWLEEQTKDIQ